MPAGSYSDLRASQWDVYLSEHIHQDSVAGVRVRIRHPQVTVRIRAETRRRVKTDDRQNTLTSWIAEQINAGLYLRADIQYRVFGCLRLLFRPCISRRRRALHRRSDCVHSRRAAARKPRCNRSNCENRAAHIQSPHVFAPQPATTAVPITLSAPTISARCSVAGRSISYSASAKSPFLLRYRPRPRTGVFYLSRFTRLNRLAEQGIYESPHCDRGASCACRGTRAVECVVLKSLRPSR